MKTERFRNEFVQFVPDVLEEGVLYVSMRYRTVSHLCPCGCRQEVPLSISPTAWKLTYNGEITLNPSVGNWKFSCRSHYFIRGGEVCWAGEMSEAEIKSGRAFVAFQKEKFYGDNPLVDPASDAPSKPAAPKPAGEGHGLLDWLKRFFR